MQEQGTPSVTAEDEARERLVEWQQEQGGVPDDPGARGHDRERRAGRSSTSTAISGP